MSESQRAQHDPTSSAGGACVARSGLITSNISLVLSLYYNQDIIKTYTMINTSSVPKRRVPIFVRALNRVRFLRCFLSQNPIFFFCSWCWNHAAERPQKNQSAPKWPYFAPFPGGKTVSEKQNKTTVLAITGIRCQEFPRPLKGPHIVFVHPFQRPRPLPHPHPSMFHIKVPIAKLTEFGCKP